MFHLILLSIACSSSVNSEGPIMKEYPPITETPVLDYDENFIERDIDNCSLTDTTSEDCTIFAGECIFLTIEEERWITGEYDSSLINWF